MMKVFIVQLGNHIISVHGKEEKAKKIAERMNSQKKFRHKLSEALKGERHLTAFVRTFEVKM